MGESRRDRALREATKRARTVKWAREGGNGPLVDGRTSNARSQHERSRASTRSSSTATPARRSSDLTALYKGTVTPRTTSGVNAVAAIMTQGFPGARGLLPSSGLGRAGLNRAFSGQYAPGAGAPGAPSLLDQALALIPQPNRADYIGPYDEAEASARQAYEAALPAIQGAYGQLRGDLAELHTDTNAQQAIISQQLQQRLGQGAAEVSGMNEAVLADLAAQGVIPELMGRTGAEANQQLANVKEQGVSEQAMSDRLAQVSRQSQQSRLSDVGLAESAAQANAATNLEGILQQIGVGRAEAGREYTADSQSAATAAAELRLEAAAADEKAKVEQAKAMADVLKEAEKSAPTAHDEFVKNVMPTMGPKAAALFDTILGNVKGKGQEALVRAMREIDRLEAGGGTYEHYDDAGNLEFSFKPDTATLRRWLEAYYDEDTKVHDPKLLQRLGLV